jgi:hypothetical protein
MQMSCLARPRTSLFPVLPKDGDGHCSNIIRREPQLVADGVSELLCSCGGCNGDLERVFEFGDAGNG